MTQLPQQKLVDATVEMLGMTWSQVGAWVGPLIASAWIWSTQSFGPSGSIGFPSTTPLAWLESVAARCGLEISWPSTMAEMLSVPSAYAFVMSGALIAASMTSRRAAALSSVSVLFLLLAVSCRPHPSTIVQFLALSLLFPVCALALDFAVSRTDDDDAHLFMPSLALMRWINGPLMVCVTPLVLPLLPFLAAVRAYRMEKASLPIEFEVAAAINDLPAGPVGGLPANELIPILASALLVGQSHAPAERVARSVLERHRERVRLQHRREHFR